MGLLGAVFGGVLFFAVPRRTTVVRVVRGRAVEAVYATGTVEAEDRLGVKAKLSGSIHEVLVQEGEHVERGQLLARLANATVTHALERGRLEFAAASTQAGPSSPKINALAAKASAMRAELDLARGEASRADTLVRGGAMTEIDRERLRSRAKQLAAELRANMAEQESLRISLRSNAAQAAEDVKALSSAADDTEIRSPIAGLVFHRHIEPGEVVVQNQVLFELGSPERLALKLAVDEADIARVREGTSGMVAMQAFRGQSLFGKVLRVLPDAERTTKSFTVWVQLENAPNGIRSGMTAEANLLCAEHSGALLVPTEAIQNDYVWLVRGLRASRVRVRTGLRDLVRTEIVEGVAEGDRLVVAPPPDLTEGTWVWAAERK